MGRQIWLRTTTEYCAALRMTIISKFAFISLGGKFKYECRDVQLASDP